MILLSLINGIKSKHNERKEVSFEFFNENINKFNYILIKESNTIIPDKDFICDFVLESLNIKIDTLRKTLIEFFRNFSLLLTDNQANDH